MSALEDKTKVQARTASVRLARLSSVALASTANPTHAVWAARTAAVANKTRENLFIDFVKIFHPIVPAQS
jgi:hypothetical protein